MQTLIHSLHFCFCVFGFGKTKKTTLYKVFKCWATVLLQPHTHLFNRIPKLTLTGLPSYRCYYYNWQLCCICYVTCRMSHIGISTVLCMTLEMPTKRTVYSKMICDSVYVAAVFSCQWSFSELKFNSTLSLSVDHNVPLGLCHLPHLSLISNVIKW